MTLKVKEHMLFVEKIQTLIEREWNRKWIIPHTLFERWTLRFSLLRIKSKTVMSWSSRKKKECIFCNDYFCLKNFFFNICVLSQCVVCWINFENIYFYILKNITSYDFLFVFNIAESLQCIFKKVMGEEAINQKTQTPKSWYIDLAYTWWKKRECCM